MHDAERCEVSLQQREVAGIADPTATVCDYVSQHVLVYCGTGT